MKMKKIQKDGMKGKEAWPSRLQSLLTSYDPSWNVEIVNLAKGGTPSVSMELCL